jgi:hypothetical protein
MGVLLLPLFWLLFYTLQGTYHDIRRLFRLKVLNLPVSLGEHSEAYRLNKSLTRF